MGNWSPVCPKNKGNIGCNHSSLGIENKKGKRKRGKRNKKNNNQNKIKHFFEDIFWHKFCHYFIYYFIFNYWFYFSVDLYNNRSQKTSKCVKISSKHSNAPRMLLFCLVLTPYFVKTDFKARRFAQTQWPVENFLHSYYWDKWLSL